MKEDADFRQVAELLAAVADRAARDVDAQKNQVIRRWLLPLAESDVDLPSVLAAELARAFQI
jgi:hypothetical protein